MNFTYKLKQYPIGFGSVIENILKNRDIQDVNAFLNPSEIHLEDESLYDNIDIAADMLLTHVRNNNPITILVDCDPDGYTSASFMYQYVCLLIHKFNSKTKLSYIVHDDKKHGLDEITLCKINKEKPSLLIIPDASSNDYEEHRLLHDEGIDIIVLDHHECEKYSDYAIVINNQLSSNIENKTLTGVGIVYKFCKYIDKLINVQFSDDFLDLVAVGMIADNCDLRNLESRYLVLKGIDSINKKQNKNKLISSMVNQKSFEMNERVTFMGVSFYLVPLLNAVIRSGTYEEKDIMFKAFINSDEKHIDKIRGKGEVELSIQDFTVRIAEKCKRKQKKQVDDAIKIIQDQIIKFNLNDKGILVVNGTNIIETNHTGLVANKLADMYQRPCLVLKLESGEIFSGSGRGYEKKEIKDFRKWCNDTGLFEVAQGHSNAFGIRININNINLLYEEVGKILFSNKLQYDVDGIFNEKSLNKLIIETVARYKDIWGNTVSEPLFAITDLNVNSKDIELIGRNKNTIKIKYKDIEMLKFNSSESEYLDITKFKAVKLVIIGKFNINEFNGNRTPQIIIENMNYEPGVVTFRF